MGGGRWEVGGIRTGLRYFGFSSSSPSDQIQRMPPPVVQSYRDLLVWNRAIDLAFLVYHLTKSLPSEERFGLQSQARRAAISIPANIAAGKGRRHLKEYLHSLGVARGSIKELETHLELMIRIGYLAPEAASPAIQQAEELSRMLAGLCRRLSNRIGR